ncbi:MAG: MFS transporter [Thaumarchaeota archaeon]|nr:MFS transporter [Nitrososphaerota archaeon]
MDRDTRLLYTISLNHFTNDGATTLISSLFPVMLGLFHLDYIQVGVLVALGLVVNVVVQPLVGRYADKVNGDKLMLTGMILILVSLLLFVIATDFLSLLLITILLRAGSSFFHPVGLTRLSKAFVSLRADRAMGFMIAFGSFGVFASFLVGGFLYDLFGWGAPFYVWAVITGITVIATWKQLRTSLKSGGDPVPAPESPPVVDGRVSVKGSIFGRLLAMDRSVAFILVASTVSSGAYTVFTSFGNLTLAGRGLNVVDANLGTALFAAVAVAGAYGLGRFRLSFSYAGLIGSMMLLGIISYIVMALVTSPALDLPMFAIAGFSGGMVGAATLAMAAEFVDAEIRGLFFGVLFAIQTLGGAAISAVSGIATEAYGLGAPYGMMVVISIPLVLWAFSVRRQVRRQPIRSTY